MTEYQRRLCIEGVADRFRRELLKSGWEIAMNFDINEMKFSEVMSICLSRGVEVRPEYKDPTDD